MLTHNWRSSFKIGMLKVLLIQFFPVALSVIFLLVYAKCNFASVFKCLMTRLLGQFSFGIFFYDEILVTVVF